MFLLQSASALAQEENDTVVLPGIEVEASTPKPASGATPKERPAAARKPSTTQSGPSASAVAGDALVVTPAGRPEERGKVAGTVQVIDRAVIERSTSQSVTELLRENAVGFFSEWTPGQTSINIRGAATDGQGKDFRSQVLVLINGRRAGTANLSKLSLADVDRVEIVRGPASVVYGSQNLGGVINIIMKSGRSAPGTLVEGATGSWGLRQGKVQHGGESNNVDYYVGVAGGERDDYHSGKGGNRMENTQWARRGATAALGYQLNDDHRIEATARTDGIYDAGFRGSGANTLNLDDRSNQSIDASYYGRALRGVLSWQLQGYVVQDVDNFKWASPNGGLTSRDHNRRELDIVGTRFQPRIAPWKGHELILGWDFEESTLRSTRYREGLPGSPPLAQVPPQDNNQTDRVNGFYFEDSQTFFGDVLGIRGGMRYTTGETSFDYTPNYLNQNNTSQDYDATTYSLGATLAATRGVVFRVGTSTGFRAPTATELAAETTNLNGTRVFGNPNLNPETNEQIEAGVNVTGWLGTLDLAVFENVISDRITTLQRPGVTPQTSDYINNPGDIEVRGVEVGFDLNMLRVVGRAPDTWRWSLFSNGYYHFDMVDQGAPATANTDRPQRMYEYETSIGTRFGQAGRGVRDWSFQIVGLYRGPMWYDTEEVLLRPLGEPAANFIHRKDPFWTWNLRGDIELAEGLKAFAGINNLLDVNEHPIFIALDEKPCIANPANQNGGCGTSMPGREFVVGLQWRW